MEAQESIKGHVNKSMSQYALKQWNTEHGLPSNNVTGIVKLEHDYVWMSTYDGLVRFDGLHFDKYIIEDGLSNQTNQIIALSHFQDNFYVSIRDKGLFRFEDGYSFQQVGDQALKQYTISTMQPASDRLWLGTDRGLAYYKDGLIHFFDPLTLLSNLNIQSLGLDTDNNLWIGTATHGLIKYKDDNYVQFTTVDGLPSNSITAIGVTSRGYVWAGSDQGLIKVGGVSHEYYTSKDGLPDNYVNAIAVAENGVAWVGTNSGLARIANGALQPLSASYNLTDNYIQALFTDDEGALWLGTRSGGTARITAGKFVNFSLAEGLNTNNIQVIKQVGDSLILGGDTGFSVISDEKITTGQLTNKPAYNNIKDILVDESSSTTYFATEGGLIVRDSTLSLWAYTAANGIIGNHVNALAQDRLRNVWFVSDGLLHRLVDNKIINYKLADNLKGIPLNSLLIDDDQVKWIGSSGQGLIKYQNNSFETFSTQDGLAGNWVFHLYQDRAGILWIATNNGISRYDGKRFFSFKNNGPHLSEAVFQIIEDNNANLWITTGDGVFSINKAELNAISSGNQASVKNMRLYNRADGMRSSQIPVGGQGVKDRSGHIWLPTAAGVSRIDPDNLGGKHLLPPAVIDKVRVDNEVISILNSEAHIAPGGRNYTFTFTGICFAEPESLQFYYKLEGYDIEWHDAGDKRQAEYANLPAGEYQFKVKVSNKNGIINNEEAVLLVYQQAYFYQTFWFYLVVGVFVLSIALFFYVLHIKNLRSRNEELYKMVEERTDALNNKTNALNKQTDELRQLNAIKDKLFSVISHDMRNPLRNITSLLGMLSEGHVSHDELQQISGNLHKQMMPINHLLENLLNWAKTQMQGIKVKFANVNLHAITEENIKLFQVEANLKEIELNNSLPQTLKAYVDEDMLKFVIRNLIANAIKFTPKSGQVKIHSEVEDDYVKVIVEDNGVGISAENQRLLFSPDNHYSMLGTSKEAGTGLGLLLSKEFVESNGGRIEVVSEESVGSKFIIYLKTSV